MSKRSLPRPLGELAVIVVGVLIALFAESQWQRHLDRQEARQYLARLASESVANVQAIESDMNWATQACHSAQTVLDHVRGPEAGDDSAAQSKKRLLQTR